MARATSSPTAPPRRRRWRRRAALAFALIALLWWLIGVTSTVRGPRIPAAPTSIFVLREAMHVGIVLPDDPQQPMRYIEYGFGDWSYFARGETEWYKAPQTILWPTQGTFARRTYLADSPARLRAVAPSYVELDEIVVNGAAIRPLVARLEDLFDRQQSESVYRSNLRMTFVRSDQDYWLGQTCADVATECLRELGCEVSFVPLRLSLRGERPG